MEDQQRDSSLIARHASVPSSASGTAAAAAAAPSSLFSLSSFHGSGLSTTTTTTTGGHHQHYHNHLSHHAGHILDATSASDLDILPLSAIAAAHSAAASPTLAHSCTRSASATSSAVSSPISSSIAVMPPLAGSNSNSNILSPSNSSSSSSSSHHRRNNTAPGVVVNSNSTSSSTASRRRLNFAPLEVPASVLDDSTAAVAVSGMYSSPIANTPSSAGATSRASRRHSVTSVHGILSPHEVFHLPFFSQSLLCIFDFSKILVNCFSD